MQIGKLKPQQITTNSTPTVLPTGGIITTYGNRIVHTFLANGTFTVPQSGNFDVLVVAGGGGAGLTNGGGAGAGGLIYSRNKNLTSQTYTVTVGNGGLGAIHAVRLAANGQNSIFSNLTAIGGGAGGDWVGTRNGSVGGSGGGGCNEYNGAAGTVGQGNAGGNGQQPATSPYGGGGGGGAGTAGQTAVSPLAGNGGDGLEINITGTPTYYAGGGGGGSYGTPGNGGLGGGGNGTTDADGGNGTDGLGGGGGGAGHYHTGGAGGSGIVIISYLPSDFPNLQYPNSSLLLHGDGVDGSNLVIDSSPSNKTVTSVGGIQVVNDGHISFNGSTQYLSIPDSTDWDLGDNWTIDTYVKFNSINTGNYQCICGQFVQDSDFWHFNFHNNNFGFFIQTDNAWRLGTQLAYTITLGQWYHIAAVCESNTIKFYVNGIIVGTFGTMYNTNFSSPFYISSIHQIGQLRFPGSLKNFRITKGAALWTSDFTPPTSYVADTNTKLLLQFHGDLVDDSGTGKAVTNVGSTPIIYPGTLPLVNDGGAIYFNGTTDYLTVPDSADFNFGANNFTIESFINFNSVASNQCLYSQRTDASNLISFQWLTTNQLYFIVVIAGVITEKYISFTPTIGVWYNITIVRNGTTFTFFINGISIDVLIASITIPDFTGSFIIGARSTTLDRFFSGYMDELRIVKGQALYTANFTPSTIAYSSDAYSKLLLHCDGLDNDSLFPDDSGTNKSVTSVQTVTKIAEKKFGTASGYFNGTSSYLAIQNHTDFNFGALDFTIDFWMKKSVIGTNMYIGERGDELAQSSNGIDLYSFANNTIRIRLATTDLGYTSLTSAQTIADTNWHHVAFERHGNTLYCFIDGILDSNTANLTGLTLNSPSVSWVLGAGGWSVDRSPYFSGYIDEFRLSKGVARYTANFTPSTRASLGREEILSYGKLNFPGFQKIADFTAVGGESSISVPVNSDTDLEYKVLIRNTKSDQSIGLAFNNDYAVNYGYQYLDNSSGSITANRGATDRMQLVAGTLGLITFDILTPVGLIKTAKHTSFRHTTGTTIVEYSALGWSYNSTANIKTFTFAPGSGTFIVGTRIIIFARRSN